MFQETDLGFEYRTSCYLVFFGKKNSSIENLQDRYRDFTFKSLHQVHGNDLLHTTLQSENNLKADAHWTNERNLALISKSADCMPVLGFDSKNNRALAIHAGWRGVQSQIIPKSLKILDSSWDLFIGPHILQNSFEIQDDCFQLLNASTNLNSDEWYKNSCADLYKIVLSQINIAPFSTLLIDTKSDLRFHSFRRDRDKAGRQNNFIVYF